MFLLLYNVMLFLSRVEYACVPFSPQDECETSRFEVRFYSEANNRIPNGVAEAKCITRHGGWYTITDSDFSTAHRTDFIKEFSVPVTENVEVCRVQ